MNWQRLRGWPLLILLASILVIFYTLQGLSLWRLHLVEKDRQLRAPDNNLLWVVTQTQTASHNLGRQAARQVVNGHNRAALTRSWLVFLSRIRLLQEGPQWRHMADLNIQAEVQNMANQLPLLKQLTDELDAGTNTTLHQLEALLAPFDERLVQAATLAMINQWESLGDELERGHNELRQMLILLLAIFLLSTLLAAGLVQSTRQAWLQTRRLHKEKAFSQHVIDSSTEAVILVDNELCCTAINPAAKQLYQRRGRNVLDQPLERNFPLFAGGAPKQILHQALAGQSALLQDVVFFPTALSACHYLEIRTFTLRDDAGATLGVIVVSRDTTEQHATRRELLQHRNHLEQLVAERTHELDLALQRERNAAELYQHFAAMVSHQFRTPLAIIDSSLQRLLRRADRLDSAEIRERTTRARDALARLTRLVDSTLGAARLDTGQIDTRPQACDLSKIIEQVLTQQPDCRFALELPPAETALIWADPIHVEHIVCNLINNACKYASPDSSISLQLQVAPPLVSCTISNLGCWPDPDNPQRLFELYWRGPDTAGQAGLGIGLYMARELARLQNGELDTCHQIPDRVSFILELPHISTQYARQDPS